MYTKNVQVCHGTKRLTPSALVMKGRYCITCMTDNPDFPEPVPSLAQVAEACDALDVSSRIYDFTHSRVELIIRNEARERLRQLVIGLAAYVQSVSNGEHCIATSAGFEAKRKRSASVPTPAPGDLRTVWTPYPGRIDLRWDGVKGRHIYEVWYTEGDPRDPNSWQLLTKTSKNHYSATGLKSFVFYSFRVLALGALGHSPLSDVAMGKAC